MVWPRMFFGPPPPLPPEPPAVMEPAGEAQPPDLPPGPERLEEGAVEISWDAPGSCPGVADLHQQIGRYLARESIGGDALTVTGKVVHSDGDWRLSLSLARPTETSFRELAADDCALLTRAAALVVAVHVDAVGAGHGVRVLETPLVPPTEPQPPPIEVEPDAPPPESSVDRRPPEETLERRRRPPLRRPPRFGLLRLAGSGGVGDLPGFLRDLSLTGGAQLRAWRIEAEVSYAPPRSASHPTNENISGSFQAVGGTVRGCWVSVFERFEIPLCAGLRSRGIRGIGRDGVGVPAAGWNSSVALAFAPSVIWSPVPQVGLFGGLGVYVGLRKPGFGVGTEPQPLFSVSAVSALISIGVETKFFSRKLPSR